MQSTDRNLGVLHIDLRLVVSVIGFLFSCISKITLISWMLFHLLYYLYKQDIKTAIHFLILLQVRSLINPGIAVYITEGSSIKWICVLSISILVLIQSQPYLDNNVRKLQTHFIIFGIYLALSGFLVSSYPTVVVLKTISYILPFLAIMVGIYVTSEENWIHYINIALGLVMMGSILIFRFPVAYLRNGHSFQGMYDHPNVCGVMMAVLTAGLLYENNQRKKKIVFWVSITLCAFMIYFSYSRTGLFSFLIVLIVGILSAKINWKNKTIIIIGIAILITLLLAINETWRNNIIRFIYKGGNSINDITNSRDIQITRNLNRFQISPLFGTGLNVPYREGIRSFSFSYDLITENGNLATALLGDMGIIGTLFFGVCYSRIYLMGKGNPFGYTVFIIPFVVSMGEMAFFSTNNFGIVLYLYFAIYLSDGLRNRKDKDEGSIYN